MRWSVPPGSIVCESNRPPFELARQLQLREGSTSGDNIHNLDGFDGLNKLNNVHSVKGPGRH